MPRAATALIVVAASIQSLAGTAAAAQSSTYEQLQTFSGLLNQIRLNYVDSVTAERLVRGAIDGMLASLDPHSYFLSQSDAERRGLYDAGRLGATGVWVDDAEAAVVVVSVTRRSPADRAGVQPGDRVVAVGDTLVAGLRAATVQARMFGERARRIRMRLERGSPFEPETVSVNVRFDRLEERSVAVARTLAPGVGYVRLEEFGERAEREQRDAVGRVVRGSDAGALVLDLRSNPGGLVIQAQAVAELFLRRGDRIFRTRGRRRDNDTTYTARRDGEFRDLALIVLIDERSASASEALAGSLQDHDRALIMGRRSFGKALMQRPFLVPPRGDVVMLTVGYVILPSGRLIQRRYRGLSSAQYRAMAGSVPGDSALADSFRTNGGRLVLGGGGIRPDSLLPAPAPLPAWWTAAADTGMILALTDSVAQTLGTEDRHRQAWMDDAARWDRELVEPFLARVRARLGVRAETDSLLRRRLGRILADRVVEVRYGEEAEEDFRLRHDADVRAAIAAVPAARAMGRPRR